MASWSTSISESEVISRYAVEHLMLDADEKLDVFQTCPLAPIDGTLVRNQMTTAEKIQNICDRIARDFHPDKIIVFGSHAYGSPGPFSDLDLLVVMPFVGSPLQQAATIITRIDPDIGIDLIVRTPAQVSERLAMQDAFMREILERGRVAYEADHP